MAKRSKKAKDPRGEMRRRWEVILRDGGFTRVGAQGRLVALFALWQGNWSTCEVRVSTREIARLMGVGSSTVARGLQELVDEGILVLVRGGGAGRRSVYVVPNRAPVRDTTVPTSGTPCPDVGDSLSRPMGQTAPPYGTDCAPVRDELRHHSGRMYSVNSIGMSINTNGVTSAETDGAVLGTAPRLREHRRIRRDHGDGTPATDQAAASGT